MTDQIHKAEPYVTEPLDTFQPTKSLPASKTTAEQIKLIERAKREWMVTVDSLPQLICLLDHELHLLRANRTLESWQLGKVMEIKGLDIHTLFHPDCINPACYLINLLEQARRQLARTLPVEIEAEDEILGRYLRLHIQPISQQTTGLDEDNASFAVLILDDITEQKQVETALHKYTLELKADNEELDAFAHTVAHNLKGPLTPIINYAQILQTFLDTMSADTIQEDLDIIVQSGKKMTRIINELLLLAGVRKQAVIPEPLDMAAIVAEVQHRLAFVIAQQQAEIILPDTWPVVLGYGPWVEEIWVNYISNGLKYGGRPPRLKLGATVLDETQNGMVRFWIQDNGQGLKPEEQIELFTPFTQLNQIQANGHGLGLSIVRRIVEKLGGQVGVTSQGIPGQGAIFSFTLPGL